jgi:hypothetical protein
VTEAEDIQARLTTFLTTARNLTFSADKTLMTPAHPGQASWLGSDIGMRNSPAKFDHHRRRVVNGQVGRYRPEDVMQTKRKRYLRDEKPLHRPALRNDSAYDIIGRYQGAYRGLGHDDGLAQNLAQRGA